LADAESIVLTISPARKILKAMPPVIMTPEAFDEFDGLPKPIKDRLRKLAKRLENWPSVSGVKALSGNLAGWYRIRTGDYRVRFRVHKEQIVIDKIGHRRDVYDD
jgi:mRNA interferase RelE/StbE